MADNWDTKFDDPIPLPDGGELVMLKDAGEYIRQLPTDIRESDKAPAPGLKLFVLAR